MMEEFNILSESIIKIEDVKEEANDGNEDFCWNAFEELEPPIAVFVGPPEKQEAVCGDEEKRLVGSSNEVAMLWSRSYLRIKRKSDTPDLKEGDLVILIEDSPPPLWKVGVVTQPLPVAVGNVRTLQVKTASGTTTRLLQKDPLASSCDDASVATIKQEITSCSPDGQSFPSEKPSTIQAQQSKSTDLDCCPESGFSRCDQTTHRKHGHPNARIHTRKKPYHCTTCMKTFTRKRNFQEHVRIHTGEKPFHCTICMKTFTRKWSLEEHMRIHTGEKPFQCSICERTFGEKASYNYHMLTHTGEKPFQCSICEKAFTLKGSLDSHMRTHTGEKPFQCSICAKTFAQKGTLDSHVRTHSGEKPFKCFFCVKRFTQKQALSWHIRIHTGEKPFQCSVCEKSFIQKGHLQKHMRTHSDEKSFVVHL